MQRKWSTLLRKEDVSLNKCCLGLINVVFIYWWERIRWNRQRWGGVSMQSCMLSLRWYIIWYVILKCHVYTFPDDLNNTDQVYNLHSIWPSNNTSFRVVGPNALPELYETFPLLNMHMLNSATLSISSIWPLCRVFMLESRLTSSTHSYQAVDSYTYQYQFIRFCWWVPP